MSLLGAVVPEAILCTKEAGERPRQAAYSLLVEMGNAVVRWSSGAEQGAVVAKMLFSFCEPFHVLSPCQTLSNVDDAWADRVILAFLVLCTGLSRSQKQNTKYLNDNGNIKIVCTTSEQNAHPWSRIKFAFCSCRSTESVFPVCVGRPRWIAAHDFRHRTRAYSDTLRIQR